MNRLRGLLQSPHLDIRLSAGEALAVIFELGRDFCDDYEHEWAVDLIEILKELATDSNKFRAKKDRKQQRASFRDILRYVEVINLLQTIKIINNAIQNVSNFSIFTIILNFSESNFGFLCSFIGGYCTGNAD